MKLTIIAATGGVGRQLLTQALDAGHDLTVVVRNPAKLPPSVMAGTSVRVVSAAGITSPGRPDPPRHDPGDGFFMRYLGMAFAETMYGKVYDDLARMEDVLRGSGLDWTVLRPPYLTSKPLTGRYRTADGRNVRGGFSVPRADVAHCMLRVLEEPETIGTTIGIAS